MQQQSLATQPIIETGTLQRAFAETDINERFRTKLTSLPGRIGWASSKYGDQLALISSFGPQSILNILPLLNEAPEASIIHIDIMGDEYEEARQYRDHLIETLGIEVYIVPIASSADKVTAMKAAFEQLEIKAFLRGIRATQTEGRSKQLFVENWLHNPGIEVISPILDWSDHDVHGQIQVLSQPLRHQSYKRGVQSKGGAILAEQEEKTECGLHFDI